ncbi:MAG TPA: acyl-ACP--UDP-N-acetylglucosamine O-acyltransferase [Thiolapillus brandeum]|uniref:Acyl-[acyl-carrier-protein]--UDP-N-acetylglucosamine O-acyltransferase n=1 Tax=Thiolapillus brandeum TaxID=1076588 RepID=A0A7C5NAV2_9GAMM|nr:acyl-ACP--UDP-N-acetylglucosamine O-acyltransferase [Thiolapillus brandeum]
MIHPTAIIDQSARLGEGVRIGPFSIIGPGVEIGDGCEIGSHVVIARNTRMGCNNRIFQFASVGEDPQDKKYAGEETWLEIGDHNVIREYATLHRGTVQDGGVTRVGSHNLLMAYTHVAHDCVIGDHTILANAASLGGHVQVHDWAILGGFSLVHQFTRVGAHSFAAMGSAIGKDVPPYVMVGGQPAAPRGINHEGLKRRGFSDEEIGAIKRAYRRLYRSGLRLEEALEEIREMARELGVLEVMASFLENPARSIVR